MSRELMLCNQNRFTSTRDMLARPAPTSAMVLQQLAVAIAAINQKVDALAIRQTQVPEVISPEEENVVVRRVNKPATQRPGPSLRINRSRLMDIFE
jgi:hypothetical protein